MDLAGKMKHVVKQAVLRVPGAGRIVRERDQFRQEREALLQQRGHAGVTGAPTELDRSLYPYPLARRPRVAFHGNLFPYLGTFANDRAHRILEVGSRPVVSNAIWKQSVPDSDYVGFDVLPGDNVDVVGDAHKLSEYFDAESFDIVISLAVFEHLAMPWLVAEEITKLLKPGGLVLVETHFSFAEHELPWHFFQFNKNALEVLFNPGLGYELVDSGMDNPMVGRYAFDAPDHLRGQPIPNLYAHSSIIARKVRSVSFPSGTDIWRATYDDFIGETMYPPHTGLSSPDPPPA
jgi:SAM-dependent methyltransferase